MDLFPFIEDWDWFSFSADYSEGLINDERGAFGVDKPRMHNKSLYLKFETSRTSSITMGLTHYVFWGGTLGDRLAVILDDYVAMNGSRDLPTALGDYFLHIFGRDGNSNFPSGDQTNAAGNQLGSYRLSYQQSFDNFSLEFRINHPFDLPEGMQLKNIKDNQFTLHLKNNVDLSTLSEFIVEYMYTGDQGAESFGEEYRQYENYFNNGTYQSGFSYHGLSMGTPFFTTMTDSVGTNRFVNNRVSALHIGAKGYISPSVQWKALLSSTQNHGTYDQMFDLISFTH